MTLEDDVTEEPVFAVAWKDKQVICTRRLTSVNGNPSVQHRLRLVNSNWSHENDRLNTHIPQAIEMIFI